MTIAEGHSAQAFEADFLAGTGDIGRLIAAMDWSATPLGPIGAWPHSLRLATAMILRAPVAMVLLWGVDGILIYNEAYAAIAGPRHPAILGVGAEEAFPEIADFNRRVIDTCLAGGTLAFKDQRFALNRGGPPEDVWFDLGYSPVPDDSGRPAGVLAVVVETTARALADERLRVAQEAGRFGAFEWFPQTGGLEGCKTYRQIFWMGPEDELSEAAILALIVPEDRPQSGVHAHTAEPRRWEEREEALMQAVAARTWDAARRATAEQNLRDGEENFRLLAEALPNQVWVTAPDHRILWVNEQAYAYMGVAPGELQREDWTRLVHPDDQAASMQAWTHALATGTVYETEYRLLRHDGTWRWHIARALPSRGPDGSIVRWIGANTDIEVQRRALADLAALNATLEERVEARTRELRQTEEALRQAQKMEAIGQLTGGIAHDFNNLLTGIIGALDLIRRRIATGRTGDLDRFMDAASSSALSAAALTHRLLAFARRQSLDTKPVNVHALIFGMAELLSRTLGEQVCLHIDPAQNCWHAMTDPNQLESAILNLAINARDAMPDGGILRIGTENLHVGAPQTELRDPLEPGDYVSVTVSDSGIGMAEHVIEKVFEPFFTTKPAGQGTGLGLSMVYGFVRQSGGRVSIASRLGQGTSVTLTLPRAAPAAGEAAPAACQPPLGAGETVLVVEDVAAVRMLIIDVLHDLGYRTIEAANAAEALLVIESGRAIDMLVSDVGLPGIGGRQLADQARARRPGLPVLFVTGYAEHATIRSGFLGEGMALITKPFAVETLAAKISDMMAER